MKPSEVVFLSKVILQHICGASTEIWGLLLIILLRHKLSFIVIYLSQKTTPLLLLFLISQPLFSVWWHHKSIGSELSTLSSISCSNQCKNTELTLFFTPQTRDKTKATKACWRIKTSQNWSLLEIRTLPWQHISNLQQPTPELLAPFGDWLKGTNNCSIQITWCQCLKVNTVLKIMIFTPWTVRVAVASAFPIMFSARQE